MMKYRTRTFYTDEQKSEMWDRWQRGESMSSIGRCFDRASSSVFPYLAATGGIRPPDRRRSRLALSLIEREEISRGLAAKRSLRAIARVLNRSPSTRSAERFIATVDGMHIALRIQISVPGTAQNAPNLVSSRSTRPCVIGSRGSCV